MEFPVYGFSVNHRNAEIVHHCCITDGLSPCFYGLPKMIDIPGCSERANFKATVLCRFVPIFPYASRDRLVSAVASCYGYSYI